MKILKAVAGLVAIFSTTGVVAYPTSATIYGTLTSWQQSGSPSTSNPGIGSLIVIQMLGISNGSIDVDCNAQTPDDCYSVQYPGFTIYPGSNIGYTEILGLLPVYNPGFCSYYQQATYSRAGGLFDYGSSRLCEYTFYPQMSLRFSLTDVPYDSSPISNLSLARASGLIGGSGYFSRTEGPGPNGTGAEGEFYGSYGGTFSLYAINYIPSPATLSLLGLGLAGIGAARRKSA